MDGFRKAFNGVAEVKVFIKDIFPINAACSLLLETYN
jgi:hypothetical protein